MQLEDECLALEQHAGIAQAMERAYQGSLFPLGAGDGEDPSPDEYFADESDNFRRRMRRAYFSVQDVDLRRKLIALRRKWDTRHRTADRGRLRKFSDAQSEGMDRERLIKTRAEIQRPLLSDAVAEHVTPRERSCAEVQNVKREAEQKPFSQRALAPTLCGGDCRR